MTRLFSIGVMIFFALLFFADVGWAQGWPQPDGDWFDSQRSHRMNRGPGGYFSPIKLGLVLALYLLWVKTTDWANRDCQTLRLSYIVWNSITFWPFLVGLFLVFLIPIFIGGYAVLVLTYAIPIGVYVVKRNDIVPPHERVMTPAHIRHLMSGSAKAYGFQIAEEKKEVHEKGAPVKFVATDGSNQKKQSNEIAARQSDGYLSAKALAAEIVDQRAEKAMLDYGREEVSVRFQIDGVWHDSESQDRESGDAILAVYKTLANLNVEERRKRQAGKFVSEYKGVNYNSTLVCQGTKTGERVILQLDRPTESFSSISDLGMREKMIESLREVLAREKGLVIFSSTPGNGLTTTVSVSLKLTDRFMRDFLALQDVKYAEPLADNINLETWDSSKGDAPEKLLLTLIRKDPDGIVCNELPNAETTKMLCEQAAEDKLVVTTVRAKEAVEALLRVLLLKIPANVFAPAVTAVVNQRLIRKLCENCKEPYEPSPAMLKKLGIPEGRIEHLFRPPDPNEQDKPCPECNGIGYIGRTAVFELLTVDDSIRDALVKQPKLDVLRQVSRKAGNRNLQQEGVVLVAQGITSLAELQRIMKQ